MKPSAINHLSTRTSEQACGREATLSTAARSCGSCLLLTLLSLAACGPILGVNTYSKREDGVVGGMDAAATPPDDPDTSARHDAGMPDDPQDAGDAGPPPMAAGGSRATNGGAGAGGSRARTGGAGAGGTRATTGGAGAGGSLAPEAGAGAPAPQPQLGDLQPGAAAYFIYDAASGTGRVALHEPGGALDLSGPIVGDFDAHWTHVVALHNKTIFFYNAADGSAWTARLNAQGQYDAASGRPVAPAPSAGWTHVVAVNQDGLFFYDSEALTGMTARVDDEGAYAFGEMIPDVRGWTHVVGTRSGSLLFYDNMAGVAARAQVNENLHYSYITDHTKLSHAWTHLTSVANLVFFYDSTNPKTGSNAYVVDLSAGSYMPYKYVDGVDSGFEQVVGASNGGLLFLDKETGSAVIGDLVWVDHGAEDPTGKFVLGAQVPNLPWTQVGAN